jgi:hypothetical protein
VGSRDDRCPSCLRGAIQAAADAGEVALVVVGEVVHPVDDRQVPARPTDVGADLVGCPVGDVRAAVGHLAENADDLVEILVVVAVAALLDPPHRHPGVAGQQPAAALDGGLLDEVEVDLAAVDRGMVGDHVGDDALAVVRPP